MTKNFRRISRKFELSIEFGEKHQHPERAARTTGWIRRRFVCHRRREDSREGARLFRKYSGRLDALTSGRNRAKPREIVLLGLYAGHFRERRAGFVGRWVRRDFDSGTRSSGDFGARTATFVAAIRQWAISVLALTVRGEISSSRSARKHKPFLGITRNQRTLHSPRRRSLRSTWLSNCACACRLDLSAIA
ncbi:hypothetical protein HN011_004421 [Eciton burchellii]|nr:hypothetical protein HN011_004421 [Eciton burchellii]